MFLQEDLIDESEKQIFHFALDNIEVSLKKIQWVFSKLVYNQIAKKENLEAANVIIDEILDKANQLYKVYTDSLNK